MSTQKTAEEIAALLHHDPDCLSWSHQECDCDYCQIASALTQLGTRALAAEQEAERLRKALEAARTCIKKPCETVECFDCEGMTVYSGFTGRRHKRQEPCRKCNSTGRLPNRDKEARRVLSVLQQIVAALAPQPTEAQEER